MAIIAHNDIRPDGLRIFYGTAPPGSSSDGTYYLGEVILAIGSTPTQPMGWRCIGGGSPGNWAQMGNSIDSLTLGPYAGGSTTGATTPLSFGIPCDTNYVITGVSVSYTSAAAAGSIMIERDIGSTPVGSGVVQLQAGISLASTSAVIYNGSMIGSPSTFIAGQDRIGVVFNGTAANIGALSSLVVNIQLARAI